ncbi:MAG: hypothetical protein SWJ54_11705 [Cyanobacteriota bacterium]|nr:hypothetical protein [Cyanobacteriota bacterium]
MTNVANKICQVEVPLCELEVAEKHWYDLVSRRGWMTTEEWLIITLHPIT